VIDLWDALLTICFSSKNKKKHKRIMNSGHELRRFRARQQQHNLETVPNNWRKHFLISPWTILGAFTVFCCRYTAAEQLTFPKLVGDRICLAQRSVTKRATNEIDPVPRLFFLNFTSPVCIRNWTATKKKTDSTRKWPVILVRTKWLPNLVISILGIKQQNIVRWRIKENNEMNDRNNALRTWNYPTGRKILKSSINGDRAVGM
jgi:hypothetical protein